MDAGWEEVERMAQAAGAADAQIASEPPSADTISRWKTLFGYTHMEAINLIAQQRADVTRDRISDDHWELIKAEKEAAGYDREAYEHSLQLKDVFQSQSAGIHATGDDDMMLLFRLGGLLDSAEKVQEVADLEEPPLVREGQSERGIVKFCLVDQGAKKRLEEWLTQQSVLLT